MKRSVVSLILLFVCISAMAADSDRNHVVLDRSSARSAFPFSDAVLVGNTLYLGGTAWWDKTDKPPADTEQEAKLAMEAVKHLLESQGMEMDDLVSVQVYCTDLGLYDKLTAFIELTFTNNSLPAHSLASPA